MSYATLQKERRCWCERTTKNDNDTVGEGITTGLILFIGIILIINSIVMFVHSVALAINKQLMLMELLRTLIVAGLFLTIGFGALYFFRKKLRTLRKKESPWER